MKTIKLTKGKAILTCVLAVVLAAAFALYSSDTYAAGNVTVNVANQSEWPENTKFTFILYKVGDYDHDTDGKAIFALDKSLSSAGVEDKLADASSYEYDKSEDAAPDAEKTWNQGWLDTANTLATYINGMDNKPSSVGTRTATFGTSGAASFTYEGLAQGLYLLVGSSTEVDDTLWTPQPMFISVLNDNKTINFDNSLGVKLASRKITEEHNVVKQWSGDQDVEDLVRPDSIAVKIMYGSTPVDTVILKASDQASTSYTYSWSNKVHYSSGKDAKSQDDDTVTSIDYIGTDENGKKKVINFEPKKDDAGWSVVELREEDAKGTTAGADAPKLRYYTTTYETQQISDTAETFKITNTYTCKSLKLIKSIDGYDDDGSNVTFSFKIEGKDSAGNVIYTNHAGVSFTKEDGLTKETVITNIPGAVESIEVTEEYSGNYKLDGTIDISELTETVDTDSDSEASEDGEAAETAESQTRVTGWTVTAKNVHDDHGPKGGIVNRYDHGKDPKADGGQAPAGADNTQEPAE